MALLHGIGFFSYFAHFPESTALIGSSGERQKQRRTLTCFECGEPGHFRRDCPEFKQRMAARRTHRAKPAEEQESDSKERLGAFTAATTHDKRRKWRKWLIDSGASSHMTPRKRFAEKLRRVQKT